MPDTVAVSAVVRPELISTRVHGALTEMLSSGELRPDERKSMRDLAERLGVSVMPVREAVARLAAQGALLVSPNRAVAVPLLSRAQFRDLTETRILNETQAMRLAVTRVGDPELKEIRALEAAFNAALDAADGRPAVKANKALHFAVYAASGSSTLLEVIRMLWLKAGPIISLDLEEKSRRRRNAAASENHRLMVAALSAVDGDGAAAALEADILSAAEFILSRDILRP